MLDVQSFIEKHKKKDEEKEWLPRLHHVLMKEYGWIPYDEFRNLPFPMVLQLLKQIENQRKEEEKAMNNARGKAR